MSWPVVDAFDRRVEALVAPGRGRPVADALAYGASALGDHGLLWFLIGVARGRHPGRRRTRALWAVTFSGTATPVVNGAVKAMVGRSRPAPRDDDPRPVRVPTSASFPSGHTLAAWCAATLLAEADPCAPAYYAAAGAIAVSRIHLRQHHASDVVAGALLGIGLGCLGRRIGRRWLTGSPSAGMGGRAGGLEPL
jgi:membrane-associated phospholipid phosphatase